VIYILLCGIDDILMSNLLLFAAQSFPTISLKAARHKDFLFTVDAVNYQINISTTFSSSFAQKSKHVAYVLVKSTSCWLLRISFCTHPTESAMPVSASTDLTVWMPIKNSIMLYFKPLNKLLLVFLRYEEKILLSIF